MLNGSHGFPFFHGCEAVLTTINQGEVNVIWRLFGVDSSNIETQLGTDSSNYDLIRYYPAISQCLMTLTLPEIDLTPYVSIVVKTYGFDNSSSWYHPTNV